ncbi:unnamed protein product, partial [marine sediment metagenome]
EKAAIKEEIKEIVDAERTEAKLDDSDLDVALTPCAKLLEAYTDGKITFEKYTELRAKLVQLGRCPE